MDRHDGVSVTPEELAGAHAMDVAVQAKHGVNYLSYWYDRDSECVFCFVEAPNKAAAEAVHKEAHGLTATKIIEVEGHTVMSFLGGIPTHPVGEPHAEAAFRTILFTDIVGSTDATQRLGDTKAMELLRVHDRIVRGHLAASGGNEVKHTGDGIMASFPSVSRAIECAVAIQRDLEQHGATAEHPIAVRIGVSAGEPVAERDDLFGAAVQLAARACNHAAAGAILVSTAVRELCVGKGFVFEARGPFELKGFAEPVALYEVAWRA
jgi:class 3 adenylate cyclase